jgi:hypothetical protein
MDDVSVQSKEAWLYGLSDDSEERSCSNCGYVLLREELTRAGDNGMLVCPHCNEETQYSAPEEVPEKDWFQWAVLEKEPYKARECFDEPEQMALMLELSCVDPRGSDISLEITRTSKEEILIKVVNRNGMTYRPHKDTQIIGSYTVIRFGTGASHEESLWLIRLSLSTTAEYSEGLPGPNKPR